jgi:hypothetical protein
MHTIKVMGGGLLLLAAFLLASCLFGNAGSAAYRDAAKYFIPVWILIAGINMGIGVTRANYTVREELPIFFMVFAGPAIVAGIVFKFA